MLQTIWFILKALVAIAVLMMIAAIDGELSIEVDDYTITIATGYAIILVLLAGALVRLSYTMIRGIILAPVRLIVPDEKTAHEKGLRALASGISALATGDTKTARAHTKKMRRFLPQDFGLSDFMDGMTARVEGRKADAIDSFQALQDHAETRALGLRGLLTIAVEKGDFRYAKVLAEKYYKDHPKDGWIIETLFGLSVKARDFDAALALTSRRRRYSAIDPNRITREEAILYFETGRTDKAANLQPDYLPFALEKLGVLKEKDTRRQALSLIRRIWAENPHPDSLLTWIHFAPKKALSANTAMGSWIEDLAMVNSGDAAGLTYCAEAALRHNQRDQAGRFLRNAIKAYPTFRACQMMNQLDPHGGWLGQLDTAHADKVWICNQTGQIYSSWQAVNEAGQLGTIDWVYPDRLQRQAVKTVTEEDISSFLLPLSS